MPNYSKVKGVIKLLEDAQEYDKIQRDEAREDHLFVDVEGGQWEDNWYRSAAGKPRYTFDMTGPIIDSIAGEMEKADFDIRVKPAAGDASKETAQVIDGLIRNIENISNASHIFNMAARDMVTCGMSGWMVTHEYVNNNRSFNQDLVIKAVPDFIDSVWFDTASRKQDRSDSRYGFLLSSMPKEEYEEMYPKGTGKSVSRGRNFTQRTLQYEDDITIGQIFYIKESSSVLYKMSDGSVLEEGENYDKIQDELAVSGVTVEEERKFKKRTVYTRQFDGMKWLNKEQKTAFSQVPLVPEYANFKVFNNATLYRGVTRKLRDPQRVFNYAMSRITEETALNPRQKITMTKKMSKGHETSLSTLNTNMDPVQFINVDPDMPNGPGLIQASQVNPGLTSLSEAMRNQIGQTAGMFAANLGANPGLQSGVAIEQLQNKGDIGTVKYFSAHETAICQTARLLIDAMPVIIDTQRDERVLKEDGSFSIETINEVVRDEDTGENVVKNDLSKGFYDVTCSSGPSFQNRQQETVAAIIEIAQVDPSVVQIGGDILTSNINAPGMDLIAERQRAERFRAGLIPVDQWTDEELQKAKMEAEQAAQQPPAPDPNMLIAQGAADEGAAAKMDAGTKQFLAQNTARKDQTQAQLNLGRLQIEQGKVVTDAQQNQQKIAQDAQETEFDQMMQMLTMQMSQTQAIVDTLNTQADTLEKLKNASGADAIVSPAIVGAINNQAHEVVEAQQAEPEDIGL